MHIEVNPRWVRRESGAFVNYGDDPKKPKDEPAMETVRDGVHISLSNDIALSLAARATGKTPLTEELNEAVDRVALQIISSCLAVGGYGATKPRSVLREQWRLRGESGEEHAP